MRKPAGLLIAFLLSICGASGPCHADASAYYFSTLAGKAGTVNNSIDGTGSAAQFYSPRGVAVDSAGNVFVADSSNHTIRKVTSAGAVSTFAGTAGIQGRTDGSGAAARFLDPYAIAADGNGNLYIADTSNNAIRKITSAGIVTSLAGSANGAQGSSDGTGSAAGFREPRGIAVDNGGNVYVADYGNHTVRKVTPAGVVTTLAGMAGIPGSTDGNGATALFKGLAGVAVDSAGNVYVADTDNRTIRKIRSTGNVTTLAGTAGMGGNTDATGAAARFAEPRGVAVDAGGTLYVADYGAHTIRKVSATGIVTTLAGAAAAPGISDGTGSSARFYYPSGVSTDSAGNVYVADTSNNTIRKISSAGVVTTLAGLAGRSSSVDGTGAAARFEDPYAVAADDRGNVYVADATDHTIRKITPDGTVTTLAGNAGSFGSSDGAGSAARFKGPLGIAIDGAGTLYVADTGNSLIRKISTTGVVTTVAGAAGNNGSNDGTGTAARFSEPNGIAADNAGNLYVADTANSTVRKITAAGVVTTLAGSPGAVGLTNGTGSAARFSVIFDVTVDGSGNVYVCDHGNHVIRKITAAGVVTTLAGSGSAGNSDGAGGTASFRFPTGVTVDSAGTVFVADTDNHRIRSISPAGLVATVGGSMNGSADGAGSAALFFNPKDVALDGSGNLYVADRGNHTIRKGGLSGSTNTPQCTLAASTASISLGGAVILTATCNPAATSYAWTAATGLVAGSGNTAVLTPAAIGAATYSVVGINAAGAGNSAGTIVTVTTPASTSATAVEFYNSGLKHYFITIDPTEAAGVDSGTAGPNWSRTGGTFNVSAAQASGTAAVCRFYGSVSPGPNSHFFTADEVECSNLRALEAATLETQKKWHYEGTAFFVAIPQNSACASGTMPVYRYYNNGFARGEDANHRFTSNTSVRSTMELAGWSYEGVAMCAPQ